MISSAKVIGQIKNNNFIVSNRYIFSTLNLYLLYESEYNKLIQKRVRKSS